MRHWPPTFGQGSIQVISRLFIVSLAVAFTGCSTADFARTEGTDGNRPSFRSGYDGVEDSIFASLEYGADSNAASLSHVYDEQAMTATKASFSGIQPKIVAPRKPLQCVPYARMVSGIALRGDAHTWWENAEGTFRRSHLPSPGAVMVVKSSSKSPLGHVAVVTKIINDREVLVDHANWLNNERIHLATPVIDVSPQNDWSAVRVWYTPGAQYGASVYPLAGFIYPDRPSLYITVANANVRAHPNTNAVLIATLPRRARVEVLGKLRGSSWYRVIHDGRSIGYIHAKLIKRTS